MAPSSPSPGKLRILQLFATYLQYGGEEGSVRRISKTLQERFDVETFYSTSEQMLSGGLLDRLKVPIKAYRNREILDKLERTHRAGRFGVWQIHNVFPAISPGAYTLAKKLDVPIIHYLHNYRFGCVNGYLFTKGNECRKCLTGNFSHGALGRCWRGSHAQSTAMALMLADAKRRGLFDQVTRWVAISEAQRQIHIQMGIPADRIDVVHHFLECATDVQVPEFPTNGHAVFIGRLSPEKGVDRLLHAWSSLPKNRRLVIAGEGPELVALQALAAGLGLENVTFAGFLNHEAQKDLWAGAAFSVIPSVWQEPFGMVVLEAWAKGRPVVAHRIGALPELITHGVNGFLAAPDNPAELAAVMESCFQSGRSLADIGRNGLECLRNHHHKAIWLDKMEEVYRDAGLL
jgi:glycosyltransferase involved in cell wall biosynthesis